MIKYVSLLRGINVSGQKKIRMADLRAHYASLGFADIDSYIQSGNVVFNSADTDRDGLQARIESAILKEYGFSVEVFLRTGEELERIVTNNPYIETSDSPPSNLYVTFLSAPVAPGALEPLNSMSTGDDSFKLSGNEIYLHCPGGYGKTKLTNNAFEKTLKISATTRNWKTVNTLLTM